MANADYDLWLLPSEPLASQLRLIIERLAKTHDSVAFEPHVTFFSGRSDEQEIVAIARRLAERGLSIELRKQGIAYSDLLSKTLFVQFEESRSLRTMYDEAVHSCSRPTGYKLNPHLSLLYKKMGEVEKDWLGRTVEVPEGSFWLDSILVIESESPFTMPAQIKNWRIVYDSRKSGSGD